MTTGCALWISFIYGMGLALFVVVFLVVRLRRPRRAEGMVLVTIGAAVTYLAIVVLLAILAWRGCG